MAGEPIGAKQLYKIPDNMQCYEKINSIEFLEINQADGNVRSVAYRPTVNGAQVRIKTCVQDELTDSELTKKEAIDYIENIRNAGIFSWNYSYRPSQGTFVNVTTQFRLKIEFAEDNAKDFVSEGENVVPDTYDDIVKILLML